VLAEAVKVRRISGIVFADRPAGRRARIAGTGLDVFQVVRDYRAMDADWAHLRQAYHRLGEPQLRAALAHAKAFPEEIEARLAAEEHSRSEEHTSELQSLRHLVC